MKKTGIFCILLVLALLLTGCANGGGNADIDSEIIPVESDDPLTEVDEMTGYLRYQTANGTQLAPVLDIQYTIIKAQLSLNRIKKTLKLIKDTGYTRVYFVVPGDGYPTFVATRLTAPVTTLGSNYESNILACGGDPIKLYAKTARSLNLEAIAIYKPYEGGGALTVPEGQTADNGNWYEDVPGGRRTYFDTFITEHPEMRIARRDNAHIVSDEPITKIEITFMLDSVQNKNIYGDPVVYPATRIDDIQTPKVTLYGSQDNYTYKKYEGSFNTTWKREKRNVYDSNGLLLYSDANVYVLIIDGFKFDDGTDYIAFTFSEELRNKLPTIPYSMIDVYCGEDIVVSSVASRARRLYANDPNTANDTPYNHIWGFEDQPVFSGSANVSLESFTDYFTNWGFEFEYNGGGSGGGASSGWTFGVGYCVTKGKPQYLSGTLCEGYIEVRQHWLNYVKYLAKDCNFDGVEIRLQNHSSFTTECINYGYNEPIADRYKELYGVDITDLNVKITEDMYVKIMKIRGEFFEMFLEEASEYLHANGKKFFMHLISAYADETRWNLCAANVNDVSSPNRPKVILDWKKCIDFADEISIRDSFYSVYDENAGLDIKKYAYEQGKICWMHIYLANGDASYRFISEILNDKYATGMLWYEYSDQRQTDIFDPLIDAIGLSRETVYVKKN